MPKANQYTSIDFIRGECHTQGVITLHRMRRVSKFIAFSDGQPYYPLTRHSFWQIWHRNIALTACKLKFHKGMEIELITLSSARTCTFVDLLTTPALLLLLTRRWPRMEENAKLHDDACDTGVEMAEVVATPATTFIVAMVAAAISSRILYKQRQTYKKRRTRRMLEDAVRGFDVSIPRERMRCWKIDCEAW